MTEKLFYKDSHMQTFQAIVQECRKDGENYRIRLDRTAFFPEGGGQYADHGLLFTVPVISNASRHFKSPLAMGEMPFEIKRASSVPISGVIDTGENSNNHGTLNEYEVYDVQEEQGDVWHYTSHPFDAGDVVEGKIDWQERFGKMQQHTGEHIISGLVHARFGYNNVGFHLGNDSCTMDFDGEISKEELAEIEWKANEAVVKNLEVQVTYPSKEELENIAYRSKIEIEGQIRIVTIPGYDVCACCAPHVKTTGEIGQIKLTNAQRYKGGVRITMLCGFRALCDYRQKLSATRQISASLCAKENETAEAVEHLKEENNALKQELDRQKKILLEYKVKEVDPAQKIVCLFEEGLDGEGPRFLMNQILEKQHDICAVFNRQPETSEEGKLSYHYVIGSKTLDMRLLVKELNSQFQGRGGGKPEMVQGSLFGDEESLRGWIQEKGEALRNE